MPKSTKDTLLATIEEDRDSLVELALAVGNLPDVAGHERRVAEAIVSWFDDAEIHAFLQPITDTSANVIARVEGSDGYPSLILTSHTDTEGVYPSEDPDVTKQLRGSIHDNGLLIGKRIGNNKGQLTAQMIAARALHRAGVQLRGDLIFAATAQETGVPQADPAPNTYGATRTEYLLSGPHSGEGSGARSLIDHGVVADYALVGESTGFALHTAQAGVLRLRLAVGGSVTYTPFLERGTDIRDNPNPFEKAAHLVKGIEEWAIRYETEETRQLDGGLMVPKAQVHEIRTSGPLYTALRDFCFIYLDIRLAPERSPIEIISQVRRVVDSTGIEADVSTYDYARGYETQGAHPLVEALTGAHEEILGEDIRPPVPPLFSMFTDANRFNEAGIPAVTYGAPLQMESFTAKGYPTDQTTIAMKVDDLLSLARIYALTAVEVCGSQ